MRNEIKIRMKNSIKLLLCLALGVFAFSSCLKNDDYPNEHGNAPVGFFTLVNSFPEAKGLLYSVDGRSINSGIPEAYKNFQKPMLYAGNRTLSIFAYEGTGGIHNKRLFEKSISVKEGMAYSAFTYGTMEEPEFIMVEDKNIEEMTKTSSAMRFFNVAKGTGKVNVFIGDESEAEYTAVDVETQESATAKQKFKINKTGKLAVKVTNEAGETIATREAYDFKEGTYYTIILSGMKDHEEHGLYVGILPY